MKPIVFLLAAFSLHARVVTSEVMLPLNTTVSVNTDTLHDQVTLSGNLHLVTQFSPDPIVPPNPIIPPSPIRVITTLVDVTGTGQTGLRYQATGTSIFTSTIPPSPIAPVALTFTGSYKLVPPNPIVPPTSAPRGSAACFAHV